jgi:outer membrane cobalamin receptor
VFDAALEVPIEYANVLLFSQRDSAQISGAVTDQNGLFLLRRVRPDNYYIKVSFMGYNSSQLGGIEVRPGCMEVDIGNVHLEQLALDLEDVEVGIAKAPVEYRIDKKVINVSQQLTAASGTAVDVLENVPSVTVDIDGNVKLRGSGNFTVLLDGRPTIMEANDALQQIPASTIDNIEIITNPSAKYEPDGVSGIINVVLKKNQLLGSSGIVNLNAGMNDQYGGDVLFNYRKGIANASLGLNYSNRDYPGESRRESWTELGGNTTYINSEGEARRGRTGFGVRGSLDLNLTSSDLVSVGMRWGGREMMHGSELDYDEWSEPGLQHSYYTSSGELTREGNFYMVYLEYRRRFKQKDHEITGRVSRGRYDGEEESTNELIDEGGTVTSGQISTEDGPGERIYLKVDYTLPLGEKNKLEAGYNGRLGESEDVTGLSEYDPVTTNYVYQPEYSHSVNYQRDIHALYGMYAGETGSFGYQAGLRGEYTSRNIDLVGEEDQFTLDRWDYFPTLHLSYQFSGRKQIMTSYSRRIHRSRGWFLEPFQTWTDAYNVRQGNPDLKPEYIDSFEAGYQTFLGKYFVSTEAYYRVTHNAVEFARSVYDTSVTLRTPENVGTEYALGTELMLNGDLFKWWSLNLMGNLYDYRIEGVLYGEEFSEESVDWNVRLNNDFSVTESTRLQVNGRYNSPSVSAQGTREGYFTTDLALKQEFLKGNLDATLQVRDLFGTAKHESTTTGPGFYSYSYHDHEAPVVTLSISYRINNYRDKRERNGRNENGFEEDDF